MNKQHMVEKARSRANDYRMGIRRAVRGLWSGAIDRQQFADAMSATIDRGQRYAFEDGARECGILPGELTEKELDRIQDAILYEMQWIEGFGQAIEDGSRANKGKLEPLFQRAEIWIGRYVGFMSEARTMACSDRKFRWTLGRTKNPCSSCVKLNGQVRRGSFWNDRGILPRVHGAEYLECHGFRCDCTLEPTQEPASRGPLPKLP